MSTTIHYRSADVDGFNVFYREAGRPGAPKLLLLHGFPSSSHMFRDLIPLLADRFHIVAPDLPGFGQSAMPPRVAFSYTFDHLAQVIDRFTEVGLVDDAEYARMLVRSRHDDRGLARRALGEELGRKGSSAELAAATLAELDPDSERATARRLVARKLASTRGLETQVRVRRTLAALGRKGYPPGIVMEVVREYLASEPGADGVERLPGAGDDGDDRDVTSGA